MEVLKQEIITFTASNITETATAWVSTTAYTANAYALFGTYIYKAVAANTDKSPASYSGIFWVKSSISNKAAMLDLSAQSKTALVAGNLTVSFEQNRMQVLAIGNYEAQSVLVEVLDVSGVTQWSYQTEDTLNALVTDWWSYVYEPYGYESDRALRIPLGYQGVTVRLTFTKSGDSNQSACGFLVGGIPYHLGKTTDTVKFGFNSFAVKAYDDFGTLSIIKRAVQDIVDFETTINTPEMPTMRRKIKEYYNDILVFILDESETSDYENLITLGTIESASVVLTEFDKTVLTWSLIEAI